MTDDIPDSLMILGVRYDVRTEAGNLNQVNAGLHRGFQGEILIDAECGWGQRRVVLVHEALHGIDQAVGTKLDEAAVTALSSGFFAFLRDNPGVVGWLMEGADMPKKSGGKRITTNSADEKKIGVNISRLIKAGVPNDQAVAEAISIQRQAAEKQGKKPAYPKPRKKKGS